MQTGVSTDYQTLAGPVTPWFDIPLGVQHGGAINVYPPLNNCYLGQTCPFANGSFIYHLPDSTTAALHNFSGTFAPLDPSKAQYHVTGSASGTNSAGRPVTVHNVDIEVTITCRSGRGGGCRKYSSQGKFTLTQW